jgi:putative glutamine amidotransferase
VEQLPRPRIAIPQPCSDDSEYSARSWPQYARAVEESGGEPVEVRLDQDPAEIARQISACSGILLPGSHADVDPQKFGEGKHPKTAERDVLREAADELLLQDSFNLRKPLFGICYGHQSMNVWKGGSLLQHLETPVNHAPGRSVDEAHALALLPAARHLRAAFAGLEQPRVNSSHHQAVARAGDGLRVTAISPEDGTIEAVEGEGLFTVGVQWHPERTFATQESSRKLFREFVDAARAWKPEENA